MWETIITLAIVLIAAIGVGAALYRAARGKSGCAGCRGCAEADDVKTCPGTAGRGASDLSDGSNETD